MMCMFAHRVHLKKMLIYNHRNTTNTTDSISSYRPLVDGVRKTAGNGADGPAEILLCGTMTLFFRVDTELVSSGENFVVGAYLWERPVVGSPHVLRLFGCR